MDNKEQLIVMFKANQIGNINIRIGTCTIEELWKLKMGRNATNSLYVLHALMHKQSAMVKPVKRWNKRSLQKIGFKKTCFEVVTRMFCVNTPKICEMCKHVFKMEQEEYTKEEIDWSYIEFVDNQDVLDLIEKKPGGVIALLDEACMFPRSTHETFAEKLYQTLKDNKRFSKPKLSRTDFTINHYAGDVTYQTDLFLDKNKDYVVPEHAALLCASKCSFVSGLFPPLHEESTKSTKFSSIATQFKIGKTKVFLRAGQMEELDACRAEGEVRCPCLKCKESYQKLQEYVDECSRITQEEYQRQLTIFLSEHPEYIMMDSNPIDSSVDLCIWSLATERKGANEYFYGVEYLTATTEKRI
ncbi:hypothetical protein KIW84_073498 [Lathyrus oleraceus]|uniref:Myosin motor domain-containing protein n=1 Tax=Pisum sativum TaxID=3888 RepID=A0A9D4VNU0_PEA|nr:hypothetical protein KIW84_073498 [Pisum sativum]